MHRSPRVVLAWAVALVLSLLTTRVVSGDLEALHRRAHNLGPDVTVVLAARDLALGATLDASDVRVVTRPASTVPRDALHEADAVSGHVLLLAVLRDDVLRAAEVAPGSRAGLDGAVPVGRRAVHLVLKDGFRPPVGAVVDVYAAADPSVAASSSADSSSDAAVAVTVARGALVLAVDDAGTSSAGSGSAVTVLVTETEAPAVAFAASNSQLSLALAPPEAACCTS
jgi:Flp pilus assembly protein CpaB